MENSFWIVAGGVGTILLVIALGVIIGAPILAVPAFLLAFGVFLLQRGSRRAARQRAEGAPAPHVPTTEEAAADPVAGSGVDYAARGHRPEPDKSRTGSGG
jgi:hypothetical protein